MSENKKIFATPKIRKFARELGANIGDVEGTQRAGRITEEDVKKLETKLAELENELLNVKNERDMYKNKAEDLQLTLELTMEGRKQLSEQHEQFVRAYAPQWMLVSRLH